MNMILFLIILISQSIVSDELKIPTLGIPLFSNNYNDSIMGGEYKNNTLYTIQKNQLDVWQLTPLKKRFSLTLDINITDFNEVNMRLLANNCLFIRTKNKLLLINLVNNEILKTKKYNSYMATTDRESDKIYAIRKWTNAKEDEVSFKDAKIIIDVFDSNLTKIKSFNLFNIPQYNNVINKIDEGNKFSSFEIESYDSTGIASIVGVDNNILSVITNIGDSKMLLLLDKETQSVKFLKYKWGSIRKSLKDTFVYRDSKKVYIMPTYPTFFIKSYDADTFSTHIEALQYNAKYFDPNFYSKNDWLLHKKGLKNFSSIIAPRFPFFSLKSFSKNIYFRLPIFYDTASQEYGRLIRLNENNILIYNKKTNYFIATPQARDFMKMKLRGKVVPINKETFLFYNKNNIERIQDAYPIIRYDTKRL